MLTTPMCMNVNYSLLLIKHFDSLMNIITILSTSNAFHVTFDENCTFTGINVVEQIQN